MKPGIHEGCTNRTEVAEWSGEERIYLKEHVERVKEGQDDISYIPGESIAVVCSSSFSESLRKKGLEGLQVVDWSSMERNWNPQRRADLILVMKVKSESLRS